MGKNMLRVLRFAIKSDSWCSYAKDQPTVRAIRRLEELRLIETNEFRQFRIYHG